jgi:hypothetical protein
MVAMSQLCPICTVFAGPGRIPRRRINRRERQLIYGVFHAVTDRGGQELLVAPFADRE